MKDKVWCTEEENEAALALLEQVFSIRPLEVDDLDKLEPLEDAGDTYYNQEMVPKVAFDDVVASLDIAVARINKLESKDHIYNKRGTMLPQTVENLQRIMASDAVTIKDLDEKLVQAHRVIDSLQRRLMKAKRN